MTEHRDGYADFLDRTIANLEVIRNGADQGKPGHYEVTQMVNSLLGLTVFAKEAHLKALPETKLCQSDFGSIVDVRLGDEQYQTVQSLIKLMRHAVAHYNIHLDVAQGEIIGLVMWNKPPGAKCENWVARIDAEDFEALTRAIHLTLKPVAVTAGRQDRLEAVERRLKKAFRHGD
jgi:hypothetical protein